MLVHIIHTSQHNGQSRHAYVSAFRSVPRTRSLEPLHSRLPHFGSPLCQPAVQGHPVGHVHTLDLLVQQTGCSGGVQVKHQQVMPLPWGGIIPGWRRMCTACKHPSAGQTPQCWSNTPGRETMHTLHDYKITEPRLQTIQATQKDGISEKKNRETTPYIVIHAQYLRLRST